MTNMCCEEEIHQPNVVGIGFNDGGLTVEVVHYTRDEDESQPVKTTLLFPTATGFGLAGTLPGCECLSETGYLKLDGNLAAFHALSPADRLITLANALLVIQGELAIMGDTDEGEWGCGACLPSCSECGEPYESCPCDCQFEDDALSQHAG